MFLVEQRGYWPRRRGCVAFVVSALANSLDSAIEVFIFIGSIFCGKHFCSRRTHTTVVARKSFKVFDLGLMKGKYGF